MKKAVDKNGDWWYLIEAVSEAVRNNRKAEGEVGTMKETVSRILTGSDYRLKAKIKKQKKVLDKNHEIC